MNENLNLVEILKDCPKGTKLYTTTYGDVELIRVHQNDYVDYPIKIKINEIYNDELTLDGRFFVDYDGECVLFPSKEQRDWSKFKVKSNKPKFDPTTLKTFDKVLARDINSDKWKIQLFSHIIERDDYPYVCITNPYRYCIPYNDDTNHLVGTFEEAPEFYRYWED